MVPMNKYHAFIITLFLILTAITPDATLAEKVTADHVVMKAFEYWRGKASVSVTEMTIQRKNWSRTMTLKAWTKGASDSLFVIIKPTKDKGNGTLKKGRNMWMFNPKVNRIIKLPPSMMTQSWQGSDFSNNDLAKTDSLINDYTHSIIGKESHEGKTVYKIRSTPTKDAAVVWGKIELLVREDHILLSETFFDEDGKPVKTMTASDIEPIDGKLFPKTWKMQKADKKEEYTLFTYTELSFVDTLSDKIFTRSNLKQSGRKTH